MEPIEKLRHVRLEKLAKIRKLGIDPFPAKSTKKQAIAQCLKLPGKKVVTAGRIMSMRSHGGATFLDLVDESGKIQLFLSKEKLSPVNRELLTLLDIGDFIQAEGEVGKTQAGEITIFVKNFAILTKSLRPIPSQWHGLKDIEERYRKRYLDLIFNPKVRQTSIMRPKVISAMRQYLDSAGFLEVETPTLQPVYGGAAARPFVTHHQALDAKFYLKISDELYLKRLIIGGFEKVYEIDKDFRNEGVDRFHNPEFTMMECYQAYADYNDMMELTEDLVIFIAQKVLGKTKVTFNNQTIDLKKPWGRLPMKKAIKELAGIDIDKLSDSELKNLLKKHHLEYEEKPTLTGVGAGFVRGIAIATLFELAERKLTEPTFITDFPKETTALCKLHRDNPSLIERFEPYIFGMEIGNAYSELNDPLLQKQFFAEQVKAAKTGDKEAHPMDEEFIEALEYGMPPTGGLGIGVDRLVMIFSNLPSIRDVILFPTLKPEK